jgi:hypothetical protein
MKYKNISIKATVKLLILFRKKVPCKKKYARRNAGIIPGGCTDDLPPGAKNFQAFSFCFPGSVKKKYKICYNTSRIFPIMR